MENLIEIIRTALRDDAEPIARRAGLVACRKLLAVLEAATDNQPMATAAPPSEATAAPPSEATATPPSASSAPTAAPAPAPRIDPAAVATLVASLGKLPPEQLLDLAIARLRAALPPGVSVTPPATPLRFQIVPLHHLERSK